MTTLDLRYDELQEELRPAVREMLAERSPWPSVLARTESPEPYDRGLWRVLANDMGLTGLPVPAALGGASAGFGEVAVVLEELGRAVAPVPYLGSAVMATRALLECGDAELLRALATGERSAALVVPFATTPPGDGLAGGIRVGPGHTLTGRVAGVADALPADVLLIYAEGALYAVEADAPTVHRAPVISLDMTRQLCDVTLSGTPGRTVATDGRAALGAGLVAGAALLASEQVGVAEWCLQSTVAYVRERHQFGRPVGSFQAVKHRLADQWVTLIQGRALARYAAACLAAGDPDTPYAAALAQAHCSLMAVRAAEEAVQLHGGIGFTWEHPAHLYLKRAKSSSIALGTADRHRSALAGMVGLS